MISSIEARDEWVVIDRIEVSSTSKVLHSERARFHRDERVVFYPHQSSAFEEFPRLR